MYRIADWDRHFETHKTRILKHLDWVPVPNKMDGDGYTELVDHPDGAAHYGAWVAILLVASRSTPRGELARAGGVPHDVASLARLTRLPATVISSAISRLLKIGWMAFSGVDPAFSGVDPAFDGRRIEGKGIEGKRTEEHTSPEPEEDQPIILQSQPPPKRDDWFESEFWPVWPAKVGKEDARKAAAKIPASLREKVIAAVADHAPRIRAMDRPIHPATWINGRRWEDEAAPAPVNRINRPKRSHEMTSAELDRLYGIED